MGTNNSSDISCFEVEGDAPYILRTDSTIGPSQPQCTVRKARKRTGQPERWPYAQKSIELDQETMGQVRKAFMDEVKILREAQHHHVVRFIDAYEVAKNQSNKPQLAIVMSLAHGNMHDFLLRCVGQGPSPGDRSSMGEWFFCLASVIDYIHGIGIRHRDIKPRNILLDGKRRVLLADFGISAMGLTHTLSTTLPQWARGRTRTHCAPEVENGGSRGRSADIFSLGAVFLEILLARDYPATKSLELQSEVQSIDGPSYAKKVDQLHRWLEYQLQETRQNENTVENFRMFSLSKDMLHKDREQRPKAFEVLEKLSQGLSTSPVQCGCADVTLTPHQNLVNACKAGSLDEVCRLVSEGLGPSKIGALHQASVRGHLPIVEYLLGSGARVNLRDHSNQTALHCAAGSGHEDIVETLLEYGANVSLLDVEGRTALHHAAGCDRFNIVQLFLDKVDVRVQDEDGQTALHFAAKRGHMETVQLLIYGLCKRKRERYAALPDKKRRTALHFAAGYGSEDVVRILLENRASPNSKDLKQQTALHFAAQGQHNNGSGSGEYERVAELLLQNGANVLAMDENGWTAFRCAPKGSLKRFLKRETLQRQLDLPEEDSE